MSHLLTVTGVAAGYQGRAVLRDISLTADPGQFISIVAPNGAGKSTLLRAIAGTLPLLNGEILLAGRPLHSFSRRDLARRVAMVGPEPAAGDYTARQMVAMGRFPHLSRLAGPSAADAAIVAAALDSVGLAAAGDRRFGQLSQGERQKVLIARGLAQEPRLLLLDEPTAHLDIAGQLAILGLVRDLTNRKGLAVVAIIHDLNLALRFSDRLMLLSRGRTAAWGRPEEAATAEVLQEIYGIDFVLDRDGGQLYVRPAPAGTKFPCEGGVFYDQ